MDGESDGAHPGTPPRVDVHVVDPVRCEGGQVGVAAHRSVGAARQQRPVLHGHHQQRAVGQPTESGAQGVDLHQILAPAGFVERAHHALEGVGDIPPPVAPARPLEVVAALDDGGELAFHGILLAGFGSGQVAGTGTGVAAARLGADQIGAGGIDEVVVELAVV